MGKLTEPLRYDSADDISRRLRGTIIRYKGQPVHVGGFGEELHHIMCEDLLTGNMFTCHSSDTDLDISSPPLGYSNSVEMNSCAYVTRLPSRTQHQGIQTNRLMVYYDGLKKRGFEFRYSSLAQTILGQYPSLGEAAERLAERKKYNKSKGWAFDRYLSLYSTPDRKVFRLKHLIDDVGYCIPNEKSCILLPEFNEPRLRSKLSRFMEIQNGVGQDNI